jgi:hypothetical protein
MTALADEVAIANARNTIRIEDLEAQVITLQERMLQAAQLIELASKAILDSKQKAEKMAIAVVNLQLKVKELDG